MEPLTLAELANTITLPSVKPLQSPPHLTLTAAHRHVGEALTLIESAPDPTCPTYHEETLYHLRSALTTLALQQG